AQEFAAWRSESHAIEKMDTWDTEEFSLTGSGNPERVLGARVTADFLPLLGLAPSLGRGITAEDDQPGAPDVAVLTHPLFQRRFVGNPAVLGQTMVMNGA